MRVRFTKNHDHTWPSRAVTHYAAGFEGTVKREVGELAERLGRAEILERATDADERSEPDETLPGNLDASLAEPQALTPNLHVDDDNNSK
jgi:hypothetical protein